MIKAKQFNIKKKNKYPTININSLDPFLLDIKKKSSKGIDIYYIKYIQENIKSDVRSDNYHFNYLHFNYLLI